MFTPSSSSSSSDATHPADATQAHYGYAHFSSREAVLANIWKSFRLDEGDCRFLIKINHNLVT